MKSTDGNFTISAERYVQGKWRYSAFARPGHDDLPPCLLLGCVGSKQEAIRLCERHAHNAVGSVAR